MIKNSLNICFAVAVVALCLCGCKEEKADTAGFEKLKNKMEQLQPAANQTEEVRQNSEADNADSEEEINWGLFEKAFHDGQIENNGGMFIRVANRVYYRVYSPHAVELTVIGLPNVDEVDANQPSKLMYYDLDAEESIEVCELKGIGSLYATIDGICIDSYPDGTPSTTLVDENGNVNEYYLNGNIMGVSDDGRSVVVGERDDNDYIIPCVYRDGKRIGIPSDDGGKGRYSSLGFAGTFLIMNAGSASNDVDSIYSYDENGALVKLGDIEPLDMETYTLSPIIEEMTPDSDGGYISVSFRDGTANALVGWKVYSFASASSGSLEIFDEGDPADKFNYEVPEISVNSKDEPILSRHKAGEIYLSENTYGDLMCSFPESNDVVIRKDYVFEQDENLTYVTQIDKGYCFDDNAAFFLEISGQRSPDEDVGWRWAYELTEIDYRMFRFDRDHIDENGWPKSEILEYLRSVGWNKGDIEYDRLVGEWKADSYNVEGEYRIAEQENGVNDEMIRFDENGDALIFFKDRGSGKISKERRMHQAGPDDLMGGDYAYIYHSEDEDPLRAGVAYISHNVLKIYYLYHFDGGSTGWYEIRYQRAE